MLLDLWDAVADISAEHHQPGGSTVVLREVGKKRKMLLPKKRCSRHTFLHLHSCQTYMHLHSLREERSNSDRIVEVILRACSYTRCRHPHMTLPVLVPDSRYKIGACECQPINPNNQPDIWLLASYPALPPRRRKAAVSGSPGPCVPHMWDCGKNKRQE